MSSHFHPLRVRDVRRETPDTVSISFDVPESLLGAYKFTQGQYLTLRHQIAGESVRRSYSICTGVHERDLRVAVKKIYGGVFSTYANEQLKVGDILDVMAPQGRFFTPLDPAQKRLYIAFAAGSGITPIMSILKTTLEEEQESQFMLFYGNRGFDHVIFREQLEELKNLYPRRLVVHHVFSRENLGSDLFFGRLNGAKCSQYAQRLFVPSEVDAYFLCGPEEMVFEVKDALERAGVDASRVHMELFATPGQLKRRSDQPVSAPSDAFDAQITVHQDGMVFDFSLPSDGSTILDAAMRAGADLPFSCKGGVCSTCKAKVLEGEASMDICYGLEPDEVAAGFILTCQAHPRSRTLVVSFEHG
jgi:ring-1,2-phenylacetyl-CoA epoxidase subunit PaaE